ncbi:MAG: hypothetical protein O7D86_01700 [Proteobacteria bacterium]|nr:hypothetical protein [Pseudomonadota bacterium]
MQSVEVPAFCEFGGKVFIEAEHYGTIQAGSGEGALHSWEVIDDSVVYSSDTALKALQNDGFNAGVINRWRSTGLPHSF